MIKFNVASINTCTETEGPHKRLAIWFQGCNIYCKGCCNPSYQPLVPKNILTIDELIKIIKDAKEKYEIEGVTYSGGEPTLQQNLSELTDRIHNLGLGIISFTGRKYEEVKNILGNCDMVIDGNYDASYPETKRKLLGSTNQRIISITTRYDNVLGWFNSIDKTIEVNLNENIIFNGDHI
ncbi:MAG: radical SAM protein [Clostridia bacterium]|nr:radical SAM protein [Clostridia bacterium]